MNTNSIRPECLKPCSDNWPTPTSDEISEVLALSGFSDKEAALALGLKKNGPRTIRKWVSNESVIPYAIWALLCSYAGLCEITWKGSELNTGFSGRENNRVNIVAK